jgi:hypothetical protein
MALCPGSEESSPQPMNIIFPSMSKSPEWFILSLHHVNYKIKRRRPIGRKEPSCFHLIILMVPSTQLFSINSYFILGHAVA